MRKVGLLMFQNMRYAPFVKMYEDILNEMDNVSYEIIYFDRDKTLNEPKDDRHIPVAWYGKGTVAAPKYEKIANFMHYAAAAGKILKKRKYDFIIVLTSFPAMLFSNFLIKNYRNKFIVDIRDYTKESFKPYFEIEKRVFSAAALCVISSPGFSTFLPEREYFLCHNIDPRVNLIEKPQFTKAKDRRIIVSYIGSISYEKQCRQLIDLIVKDDRFEFHLYGNEANGTEVSDYVSFINNPRIKMMGAFTPEEKTDIYARSDLVFNCYGNDRLLVKYAVSNKYYDGALYRKPLLVSPMTSMADFSGEFAYALDLGNITDLNGLYQWYQTLDGEAYTKFADELIENAIEENQLMISEMKRRISAEIKEKQ